MKKSASMRMATMLLVLTLITSCFVGGTFAKYTTMASGADTARVAKFGVELSVPEDMFGKAYKETANTVTTGTDYSVKSDAKVVAPGTKGDNIALFGLSVLEEDLEVAVNVEATLKTDPSNFKMITLPANTGAGYKDFTAAGAPNFTVTADYNPIKWTLNDGSTDLVSKGTLQDVEDYISANINGDYYPAGHSTASKHIADLAAIAKDYTLSWEWTFEDGKDKEDTYLGEYMAGKAGSNPAIITDEAFDFSITITQID